MPQSNGLMKTNVLSFHQQQEPFNALNVAAAAAAAAGPTAFARSVMQQQQTSKQMRMQN